MLGNNDAIKPMLLSIGSLPLLMREQNSENYTLYFSCYRLPGAIGALKVGREPPRTVLCGWYHRRSRVLGVKNVVFYPRKRLCGTEGAGTRTQDVRLKRPLLRGTTAQMTGAHKIPPAALGPPGQLPCHASCCTANIRGTGKTHRLGTWRSRVPRAISNREHVLSIDGPIAVDVVPGIVAVERLAAMRPDGEHVLGVDRAIAVSVAGYRRQAYASVIIKRTTALRLNTGSNGDCAAILIGQRNIKFDYHAARVLPTNRP